MSSTPNPKMFFGLTGLTLIGGGAFLFMQNSQLSSLRSTVAQLSEKATEQKQINSKLDDSKKSLADLRAQLSHLEQGIPDAAYVPTMLKELEVVGKQQGIEVTGLRPMVTAPSTTPGADKDADKKPYQQLDLQLKGRGKYQDLVTFVRALNTFPKIVAARTVDIAPAAKGQDATDKSLEITMNLRAFLFKQNPAPAPPKPAGNGGAA